MACWTSWIQFCLWKTTGFFCMKPCKILWSSLIAIIPVLKQKLGPQNCLHHWQFKRHLTHLVQTLLTYFCIFNPKVSIKWYSFPPWLAFTQSFTTNSKETLTEFSLMASNVGCENGKIFSPPPLARDCLCLIAFASSTTVTRSCTRRSWCFAFHPRTRPQKRVCCCR